MKPIAPNTLIQNRYLVVHLIGKGGMGEVYLAVDQRLGSVIALKRTYFSDDEQLGNAFEREARTLARLRHPVLPKVSDHFTEQATQYLVMEHISGEDISKRLELTEKPFPLSWVLFWADHLLDALTYLHTHEPPIIHRDIKPQNLKLTDENNIVLLDFGLSKNSVAESHVSTTGGSIVGYTPHYAPMEQIRGTGTDARSDIYSLSATLYQILTNTVPSDALTRADALINGFKDPIIPINEINEEVSKSISDVILKGMSVSQDQRYSSAREMQKVLRDAYSKIKTEMSAQTAALNNQAQSKLKPSQIVTEVVSTPPPVNLVSNHPQPQASQTNHNPVSNQQSFNSPSPSSSDSKEPQQDFDATLRYEPDLHDSTPKQSNVKTEVFIAGSSPEITAAQNGEFDKKDAFTDDEDFSAEESFDQNESSSKTDNFDKNENFSPGSTVPLFSFDNQTDEAASSETALAFDAVSPVTNDTASNINFVPQRDYSPSAVSQTQTPVQSFPKKKLTNKMLVIGGGLGAFLILALATVGIAWYLSGGSETSVTKETPTPTPQATVEFSPTPEPMLEAVTDNNTNTNTNVDTNSNSSIEQELVNTNTNNKIPEQNNRIKQVQNLPPLTPVRVSTPKPNQQVVTVKTPTSPPVKTPVPKKTPVKGSRTDILQ
ncbi:MAG: serine/threonine protein kinase [Pyrinomonadaceae bacterium]